MAINRELRAISASYEKLSKESSALCDQMIAEGRGHERPSDYEKKTDPLSVRVRAVATGMYALRLKGEAIYGPDWRPGMEIWK